MNERIRIRIGAFGGTPVTEDALYGWATHDTKDGYADQNGYTVEWDDGYADHPSVRWFFKTGLLTTIHEVPEADAVSPA